MSGLITIVKAIETCISCPMQWDLWDGNDQYYYFRYRHGRLTVHPLPSPDIDTWGDNYPDNPNARVWYSGKYDDPPLAEMLGHVNMQLAKDASVTCMFMN